MNEEKNVYHWTVLTEKKDKYVDAHTLYKKIKTL